MRQKLLIILTSAILLSCVLGVVVENHSFAETDVEPAHQSQKTSRLRGTIIVDCNGFGDYTRIETAIDNAKDRDIIRVWDGIYNEDIYIDKKISLVGNGSRNTTIKGHPSASVISIVSDFVNISGFNITGATNKYCDGIKIKNSDYCNIFNNKLCSNYNGIELIKSNFTSIFDNNCSNNKLSGIIFTQKKGVGSNNVEIYNNFCNNNNYTGIGLSYSNSNIIYNNICKYNVFDLYIHYSNFNNISNNSCYSREPIHYYWEGVSLSIYSSNFNRINNNKCTGVWIYSSISNIIENNTLINKGLVFHNNYDISAKYWSSHHIVNNTINSKSIYFIKNSNGITIPMNIGQIFLINCSNITIENQIFNGHGENINLINSTNIIIKNNTQINEYWFNFSLYGLNWYFPGIFLYNSDSNMIKGNNCSMHIFRSNFNTIENNSIKNKGNAIWIGIIERIIIEGGGGGEPEHFLPSNKNFIRNNTLENNYCGILTLASDNNIIYNNSFINNKYGLSIGNDAHEIIVGESNQIFSNLFVKNDIGIYIYFREVQRRANSSRSYELNTNFKNNEIYFNDFLFNNNQVDYHTCPQYIKFNNSEIGNYWSDYNGTDQDSDGIGDTNLPWHGVDWYPLMEPIQNFSSNITRINIRRNLNLKFALDQEQYNTDDNVSGNLFIENNNQIYLYTVDPLIYGENITISPNILFEINDLNLTQKYYSWDTQILKIQAKSNQTFNFSLSGFNTTKAWTKEQFKLPPGNYSIQSTFRIYIDMNFYFDITSNKEYFEIFNQTLLPDTNATPTFDNLSVTITLSKEKFQFGEPITGTFNVSNNNIVDFESDNAKFQYLWGYVFEFQSLENFKKYSSAKFYFILDHFQIKANRTVSFDLRIWPNKVYRLPNNSEEDNYTNLKVGNYSIHGLFFFGESSDFISIKSNNVTFQIVENRSFAGIKKNIYIQIFLNKSKYEIYEPITGTVIIFNNNSFDIILNDPLYQKLFGVFFGIYSLDYDNYSSIYDRHFEANIDHLQKYYIKAKSSIEIKFKIEKYVRIEIQVQTRSIPDGNITYHNSSSLPPGKYYIAAYIHDHYRPDYELEIIDEYKILSNIVKFSILEEVLEEISNISINLQLSKSVYMMNESINGTINITNNNPFLVELEKNMLSQRLTAEHFEISSIETLDIYGALLNNIKYPIIVKAQNYTIINFEINKIFKLPVDSRNITYTKLEIGNYSIFAYFYYGNLTEFTKLKSNYVTFEIIDNKSDPRPQSKSISKPPIGNGTKDSFGSLVFYTSLGAVVIIILISTAFIAGTEVGKYGFFSALTPLYTKRRKKKDKDYGYKKGLVQGYIVGNPGDNYNAIKRALDLKNGTLAYYLKVLLREEIIKSERDGMYKRFYPTKGIATKEVFELSAIQQKIFQFINRNSGCSQTEISKQLDIIQSKISYHINLMVNARIIRIEHEGNKTKCFIIDDIS